LAGKKESVMSTRLRVSTFRKALGFALALWALASFAGDEPKVDDSSTTRLLASIKHKPGAKPVVAVYEVRSTTPTINTAAALDMFTTALIKARVFAVVERQRLNAGIAMERQLNASGATTGSVANAKLDGADYVFEVAFTESNQGENQRSGQFNIGSGTVGAASSEDSLGLDVRIVSVASSIVVDSVNVTKKIDSGSGVQASNVVSSLASVFMRNRPPPTAVSGGDINTAHKDSMDRAVRSCIETAVAELAKRIEAD
jgi:curli biogenesis system outer membrane secretion channel CsgG